MQYMQYTRSMFWWFNMNGGGIIVRIFHHQVQDVFLMMSNTYGFVALSMQQPRGGRGG